MYKKVLFFFFLLQIFIPCTSCAEIQGTILCILLAALEAYYANYVQKATKNYVLCLKDKYFL